MLLLVQKRPWRKLKPAEFGGLEMVLHHSEGTRMPCAPATQRANNSWSFLLSRLPISARVCSGPAGPETQSQEEMHSSGLLQEPGWGGDQKEGRLELSACAEAASAESPSCSSQVTHILKPLGMSQARSLLKIQKCGSVCYFTLDSVTTTE